MTPTRAITDPDLRQCSPAAMARELGWPRPAGTTSWSWELLMDIAGRRYALNCAHKADAA